MTFIEVYFGFILISTGNVSDINFCGCCFSQFNIFSLISVFVLSVLYSFNSVKVFIPFLGTILLKGCFGYDLCKGEKFSFSIILPLF